MRSTFTPRTKTGRGHRSFTAVAAAGALVLAACGSESSTSEAGSEVDPDLPTIVTTSDIWADVTRNVICDGSANVVAIIPPGGDPHAFEPSLADRETMDGAALVVANGLSLEERLLDTIEAVEDSGIPVFEVAEHVETIEFAGGGHGHGHGDEDEHHDDEDEHHDDEDKDEHSDEEHDHDEDEHHDDEDEHAHDEDKDEHSDEEHDHDEDEHHDDEDEHAHAHDGDDPHIWFDPQRVSDALPELGEEIVAAAGLDADAINNCVSEYQEALAEVDAEVEAITADIPAENRKLITNHDALGYFAERYNFEVIGAVIPSPSTLAETNPAELEELAEVIADAGIPAIFAESQHSSDDAEALAEQVGSVDVVTLNTGTLGEGDNPTYIGFMKDNATAIADALG